MPIRTQGNRGARPGAGAQRVPSNAHRTVPEAAAERETVSPLHLMARRIREEQGVEGLTAFLAAMTPFAAHYELKNIALSFGLDYESISYQRHDLRGEEKRRQTPDVNMADIMSMLGAMNGAGGGRNMGANGNLGSMMQFMRLMPMLQNMQRGGGDIAQMLKMMGG